MISCSMSNKYYDHGFSHFMEVVPHGDYFCNVPANLPAKIPIKL